MLARAPRRSTRGLPEAPRRARDAALTTARAQAEEEVDSVEWTRPPAGCTRHVQAKHGGERMGNSDEASSSAAGSTRASCARFCCRGRGRP